MYLWKNLKPSAVAAAVRALAKRSTLPRNARPLDGAAAQRAKPLPLKGKST